eukprot:11192544-Lingulodinium_polyedra.AAC.1
MAPQLECPGAGQSQAGRGWPGQARGWLAVRPGATGKWQRPQPCPCVPGGGRLRRRKDTIAGAS